MIWETTRDVFWEHENCLDFHANKINPFVQNLGHKESSQVISCFKVLLHASVGFSDMVLSESDQFSC